MYLKSIKNQKKKIKNYLNLLSIYFLLNTFDMLVIIASSNNRVPKYNIVGLNVSL